VRIAVIGVLLVGGCGAAANDRPTEATGRVVGATTSPYLEKVQITDLRLWRYDPAADRWERQPRESVQRVLLNDARIPGTESHLDALVLPPEVIGLYWLSVTVDGATQSGFMFKGRVRCNDVDVGQPPPGRVAACVPFANSAKAQFVPDPEIHRK
jgi:hypothetical protein